jgi:RHS repeat-associated protein
MPEINFFWDPLSDNILQERDETGAVTAEYTAEPGLYGNIISQNRDGVESQFHYDAQGSTLAVTDDNQNATDTLAYTAFGELTERTGTTEVPFQYIGQKGYYTDGLTGQVMVRRRPYESNGGRWLAQDPLRIAVDRINVFAYARNSPGNATDPSGLLDKNCDENEKGFGSNDLVLGVKVLDFELYKNTNGLAADRKTIKRKTANLVSSDNILLVLIQYEYWSIYCCEDKCSKAIRLLDKEMGKSGITESYQLKIGSPPGPATSANAEEFVKYAYPEPAWIYGGDPKTDRLVQCMQMANKAPLYKQDIKKGEELPPKAPD